MAIFTGTTFQQRFYNSKQPQNDMKKKGRKRRRKKPVTQFLTDDVIMTSTVDAVDLKIAALHEARGTMYDIRYLSYMYVRPGGTL